MNEERRRAIIAELALFVVGDQLADFEFTVKQLREQLGITESAARDRLKALQGQGLVKNRFMILEGKRVKVWWRPEDEPCRPGEEAADNP